MNIENNYNKEYIAYNKETTLNTACNDAFILYL